MAGFRGHSEPRSLVFVGDEYDKHRAVVLHFRPGGEHLALVLLLGQAMKSAKECFASASTSIVPKRGPHAEYP